MLLRFLWEVVDFLKSRGRGKTEGQVYRLYLSVKSEKAGEQLDCLGLRIRAEEQAVLQSLHGLQCLGTQHPTELSHLDGWLWS